MKTALPEEVVSSLIFKSSIASELEIFAILCAGVRDWTALDNGKERLRRWTILQY